MRREELFGMAIAMYLMPPILAYWMYTNVFHKGVNK